MTNDDTQILVVDDDARLRDLLKQYLKREGYTVICAEDAAQARTLLEADMFDLAIVDVMMPGESGVELVKGLRSNPPWPFAIPVLMLTAQNEPENRIEGLEAGADDYLGKPFEPRELILRIEKLLQRKSNEASAPRQTASVIKFGNYVLNITAGDLRRDGQFVNLTSGEQALLCILARHMGEPVSREEISQQLNGISERSVDVQITRLRKRIEENPAKPRYIQSRWGKGYVLRDQGDTNS